MREFLLGLILGWLLFRKDNNRAEHQGIVYCTPPIHPRPKRGD